MVEELDEDKTFSIRRAKRGAKKAAVLAATKLSLTAAGATVLAPEYALTTVTERPLETVAVLIPVLGVYTLGWATVGAVIDGYRPASRFVYRQTQDLNAAFGEIRSAISRISATFTSHK